MQSADHLDVIRSLLEAAIQDRQVVDRLMDRVMEYGSSRAGRDDHQAQPRSSGAGRGIRHRVAAVGGVYGMSDAPTDISVVTYINKGDPDQFFVQCLKRKPGHMRWVVERLRDAGCTAFWRPIDDNQLAELDDDPPAWLWGSAHTRHIIGCTAIYCDVIPISFNELLGRLSASDSVLPAPA